MAEDANFQAAKLIEFIPATPWFGNACWEHFSRAGGPFSSGRP